MSNRDDWPELAREIASAYHFEGNAPLIERLEAELHNAFVAGQEHENAQLAKQVKELQARGTELENARRMWRARAAHARAMLIDVLIDAPTVARMCAGDPQLATSLEAVMVGSAQIFGRIEQLEADAWTRAHACAAEFVKEWKRAYREGEGGLGANAEDDLAWVDRWVMKFEEALKPVE